VVQLFVVGKSSTGGQVFTLTDSSGYNGTLSGTPTSLITRTTNTELRGVALTPEHANTAPISTLPTTFSATEDTDQVLSGLSVTDTDAATDPVVVTLSVPAGILNVSTTVTGGVTAGQVANNNSGTVTITAPIAAINATLADAAGLTFSPAANANGDVTLTMTTNDQGSFGNFPGNPALTDTDTATITVAAVNDAPVNTLPATFATDEDTSVVLAGISAADVDAGSADVSVTLTVPGGAGTLRVATGVLGGVTPDQVHGNDSSAVTLIAPLATVNATLADAAGLIYFPAADYNGTADLSMVTDDQGSTGSGGPLSDTDHATITINAVDDPPVVSVPGDQTTAEDTPIVFTLAGGNPITVADVDAGAGLKVTLTATNGTVQLGGTTGLDVTGNGTAEVTAIGTPDDLNAALAGLAFTPDPNFNGTAGLRVLADDQGNTGSGGPLSNFMDVSIDVTPVNDPPVNVGPISPPNTAPAVEDTPFAFAGDFSFVINDVDAGTGLLSTSLTTTHGTIAVTDVPGVTIAGNGTTAITATGTLDDLNAALAGLTFAPDANYFGPAAIDVVTDDQGNSGAGGPLSDTDTFAINVAPVNDPPVFDQSSYSFSLGDPIGVGTVVGQVTATDVESTDLTYVIAAGDPGHHFAIGADGTITVADPVGVAGTYTLTVTSTDDDPIDPQSGSTTVTIIANSAPTTTGIPNQQVNEDAAPITLHLADDFTDADQAATSLAYSVTGNTNAGLFQSIVVQGADLIITPKADASGSASLTVRATDDGGLFTESTFTVTVNPVNDAPTLDAIGDVNIAEDAGEQTINLTGLSAGPADEAGQTLTITATSSDHALFADPTVTFTGGSTGSIKFTPLPNANGVATVTVAVTDNGGTTNGGADTITETFVVTVGAVEDRPVIDATFTPLLPTIKLPIPKGTTPGGGLVSDLVAHISDPDAGDPKGIAITRVDTTAGTWQFFNGTQWQAISGVSDTTPLLLPADSTTKVRLLPGPKSRNKYASLSYWAWDQTAGTPDQVNTIDPATHDTVSLETERAWIAVGKPRPVVNAAGQPNLTPVRPLREDHTSAAFTVKSFLTFLGLEAKEVEPTVKAFGIALSGDTGGTWQFNTGKGGWRPVPAVSDGVALLLRPTDRLRLIPTPNSSGVATITYHTWDQATGAFGTTAGTAAAGFSPDTETAVLTIAPVNDAPVVTSPPTLGTLSTGQASTGQTVADFLLGHATDVDSTGLGIQLLPASTRIGAWQFSTDGGTTWQTVKKATELAPDVMIRLQAAATAKAGSYSLTFKVWDQTGKAGTALSKLASATLTIA
jgi:hypothetical protein